MRKLNASQKAWLNSLQPVAMVPARTMSRTIARVTRGPAIATSNSVAGLSDSRSMRATPPKIQSWMLEIPIPLRRAAKAWPSSCRRIAPKKPSVLAIASAKAVVPVLGSPEHVAVELGEPEDEEEEDEEPGPVDGDPDPAHVKEGYRAAAEHPPMVEPGPRRPRLGCQAGLSARPIAATGQIRPRAGVGFRLASYRASAPRRANP